MKTTRYEIFEAIVQRYLHVRLFNRNRAELLSCFASGLTPLQTAIFIISKP